MPFIGLRKPRQQTVAQELKVGDSSPGDFQSRTKLTLVVFLRHIGCPFAEALIKNLSMVSNLRRQIRCVAVCHGRYPNAKTWLSGFDLSSRVEVIVDTDRVLYGRWGVGYANSLHLANPAMLISYVKLLSKGIHNRDASGTRWQKHAAFLVDTDNIVVWKHMPKHVGDLPNLLSLVKDG